MASFSFRTCKKVEESSEGSGEGGREEEKASNTMAHERHISVCRTEADGGRTRRTDNGNRNRSGGRPEAAGPTRRDVRKMGRLEKQPMKARQNTQTRPTSHRIVITFISSVGNENREFGLSEFR